MSALPDEIWARILELGVHSSAIGHQDLCRLAIAGRRLRRLASDPSLWATLLALDFPNSNSNSNSTSSSEAPSKSLYKTRFEKDKARREAARRRAVFEAEGRVAACRRRMKELEEAVATEGTRLKAATDEIERLQRVRRASVALNVWQPEVVRGRQKQLVQQCTVPVDSRLSDLRMELRV